MWEEAVESARKEDNKIRTEEGKNEEKQKSIKLMSNMQTVFQIDVWIYLQGCFFKQLDGFKRKQKKCFFFLLFHIPSLWPSSSNISVL